MAQLPDEAVERTRQILASRASRHQHQNPVAESAPLEGEVIDGHTSVKADAKTQEPDDDDRPLPVRIMRMQKHFDAASAPGFSASQLAEAGVTALKQVENLAQCDPLTVLGALMTCAQNGLFPFGQQAHLVPFYSTVNKRYECTFIAGYQGMIEVLTRSGRVRNITCDTVRTGDEFRRSSGTSPGIHHIPDPSKKGEPTGYYCVVFFADGGIDTEYMTHNEMMAHRDDYGMDKVKPWDVAALENSDQVSKRYKKIGGQWMKMRGPWFNNQEAMAWKTVIRREYKYLSKGTADFTAPAEVTRLQASDETVRVNLDPDAGPEHAAVSIYKGNNDE